MLVLDVDQPLLELLAEMLDLLWTFCWSTAEDTTAKAAHWTQLSDGRSLLWWPSDAVDRLVPVDSADGHVQTERLQVWGQRASVHLIYCYEQSQKRW